MTEVLRRRASDADDYDDLHCGISKDTHNRHHEFIEALIEDHHSRMQFRKGVIEKTVASLVWSILVAIAVASWSYVKDHLK
jgi:hypothetical protein